MTQTAASGPLGLNFPVGNGSDQRNYSAAFINSFRVANVMDRLAASIQHGQALNTVEFYSLCLTLARGIDYAVANEDPPTRAQDLPPLMKQICDLKLDVSLLGITMVLLISIKNACKVGWFPQKETEEILTLANEVGRNFCSPIDVDIVTGSSDSVVATVMERFYPHMKMGRVLTSLEVKPGYGVYTNDFHILKKECTREKIWLFVAQVDKLDTSACIITPQQVSFLINGRGVARRTSDTMDNGPQMPTNVTALLKYGTNLLQAVGQFNGPYIIVIAFMSETPLCGTPLLPDYVQPLVDGSDSDADIIEGPSRISLNCPISYSRIKTPVKGHLCKHLQCFDFSNFVDINTRRPSWRCPHCNQSVCYLDIRLDQNMVRVLKEVGDDVVDVIIFTDGSWKAVLKNDAHMDEAHGTNSGDPKERSELQESTVPVNALPTVVDLGGDNNEMDTDGTFEIGDIKPSIASLSAPPHLHNSSKVNQNVNAVADDWPGLHNIHTSSGLATTPRSDSQVFVGAPQSTPASSVQTPSILPALNREAGGRVNTNLPVAEVLDTSLNNLQLQQMPNSISSNDYGRFPTISRTVSRTPIAVQALPARFPAQGAQRSRPSLNASTPSSTPIASQVGLSPSANGFNTVYSDTERQQHFSRSLINPPQSTTIASSSPQQRLVTQNLNRQDHSFASPVANSYRSTSSLSGFQNAHLQQAFNPRTYPVGRSSLLSQTPIQQGSAQAGTAQASPGSVVQQARIAPQMNRQPPLAAVQNQSSRQGLSTPANAARVSTGDQMGNIGGPVQADSRADGSVEQNWRPAGRMRGSLSGRDYSHFRDMMIRPTQQAQPAGMPSLPVSSPPPIVPTPLQALLANNRNANAPQPHEKSTQ